jgi:hypothetical protein
MSKMKPAIICGGALSVLLVITALIANVTKVGALGCCNCLWPIAAGLLATFMYIRGSQTPATMSDGAVVGLLAGVIGGLINVVVGLPIQYFLFAGAIEAQMAQLRQQVPNFPFTSFVPFLIIGGIIGFICIIVLSIIGGLIAIPIFEKRKGGDAPPTAPQGFGGGQPGGGYGSAA